MELAQSQQVELFQGDAKRILYAELCNAFYARELLRLSASPETARLSRLIKSLPYYVERAAFHIVNGASPLTLDSQNGSWIAKQMAKAPVPQHQETVKFIEKHAQVGLLMPVLISSPTLSFITLDTLDQVSLNRVHCNQYGWFDTGGNYQDTRINNGQKLVLLKPNKRHLTAACCGHRWQNGKRIAPRVLSLREMLLASRINWQNNHRPLLGK